MSKYLTILKIIVILNLLLFSNSSAQENDKPNFPKGLVLPQFQEKIPVMGESIQTIIYSETFETGGSLWSKTGSWAIGNPTSGPNSGYNSVNCAATNLSGNYLNSADDWFISPTISIPVIGTATQITLSFREWFETESTYDVGHVKISTNNGSTWTTIDTRSGSSNWREKQINITTYENKQIKLGFHFTSDGSVTKLGWYIDNIEVSKNDPIPLAATMTSLNSQNFPFVYMNVAVDTFGVGFPGLTQTNFNVHENNVLQTDYFQVVPPSVGSGIRLADIVFVLDVTGSMGEEIAAVKNNMLAFANSLASSGINYGIGVIVFGDIVYAYNSGNFYYNQTQILSTINNITLGEHGIGSGTDTPENQLGAMYAATLFNFRPGAQRIQIMLTDAHSHENDAVTSWSVTSLLPVLQNANITVYPVFDTNKEEQRNQYIPIAQGTNTRGTYFHIYNNFNTIINEIQTAIANSYVVSYRSSNPVFDGTTRNVNVVVSYNSNTSTATGSYVPGSVPSIQRTAATIAYHNQAWAEGTTFNIEAEIVDNVTPYVSSATLYYKKTTDLNYSSVTMIKQTGNVYRGIIPTSAVRTPGLDYYITATDGNSTASDPKVNPSASPYQLAILPNVAPSMTHNPITTLTPGTPITITATIIDNTNTLAVQKLFYRKTGQLIYQEVNMNNTGGNNYQVIIPTAYVTTNGIDYYIYAADNFGVSSTHGTADNPHIVEPLYDLGFRPNPDGWQFGNDEAVMWPSAWWNKFDYTKPPYPIGWPFWPINAESGDFPDWSLFVETFGETYCYLNPPPGLVIYNPFAVNKWRGLVNGNKRYDDNGQFVSYWSGSCFGFSTSSLLFFNELLGLGTVFPGRNNLFDEFPESSISRSLVNKYFLYQFGEAQQEHAQNNWTKSPLTTLTEFKQLCISSTHNGTDRTLSLRNQFHGGGGHSVVPYKIHKNDSNPNIEYIYIYDNNFPNDDGRRITINSDDNTWSYNIFGITNWGGSRGLFLRDNINTYSSHPLPIQSLTKKANTNDYIQLFNSSRSNIVIRNIETLDSMGTIENLQFSTTGSRVLPIVPEVGRFCNPIGYVIPSGIYDFKSYASKDSLMYLYVLSDSFAVSVEKINNSSSEVDMMRFDLLNKSLRALNTDIQKKPLMIQLLLSSEPDVLTFRIKDLDLNQNDSIFTQIETDRGLKIINFGSSKNYNLKLIRTSRDFETIFEHSNIQLQQNSVQKQHINWDNFGQGGILILNDNDFDGTWDDSLKIDNQYLGESPPTPGPLSNENIYAYPNPFNPEIEQAKFRFKLGKDGNVTITVFDISNTKVKAVVSGASISAGVEQSVIWNGRNDRGDIVGNGVYFYIIESSSGERAVGKLVVLK